MGMNDLSINEIRNHLARDFVKPGDTAVDATSGSAEDTAFLNSRVGDAGQVLSIDFHEEDLDATRTHLESAASAPRVILFNLNEDAKKDTTLSALGIALEALARGGALFVSCEAGVDAGAVNAWGEALDEELFSHIQISIPESKPAPALVWVVKR